MRYFITTNFLELNVTQTNNISPCVTGDEHRNNSGVCYNVLTSDPCLSWNWVQPSVSSRLYCSM